MARYSQCGIHILVRPGFDWTLPMRVLSVKEISLSPSKLSLGVAVQNESKIRKIARSEELGHRLLKLATVSFILFVYLSIFIQLPYQCDVWQFVRVCRLGSWDSSGPRYPALRRCASKCSPAELVLPHLFLCKWLPTPPPLHPDRRADGVYIRVTRLSHTCMWSMTETFQQAYDAIMTSLLCVNDVILTQLRQNDVAFK